METINNSKYVTNIWEIIFKELHAFEYIEQVVVNRTLTKTRLFQVDLC